MVIVPSPTLSLPVQRMTAPTPWAAPEYESFSEGSILPNGFHGSHAWRSFTCAKTTSGGAWTTLERSKWKVAGCIAATTSRRATSTAMPMPIFFTMKDLGKCGGKGVVCAARRRNAREGEGIHLRNANTSAPNAASGTEPARMTSGSRNESNCAASTRKMRASAKASAGRNLPASSRSCRDSPV